MKDIDEAILNMELAAREQHRRAIADIEESRLASATESYKRSCMIGAEIAKKKAKECKQIAEWLKELKELRKKQRGL